MQRAENDSDAFFPVYPGGNIIFCVFGVRMRLRAFYGVRATGVMVNGSVFREGSTGFVVGGNRLKNKRP